MNKRRLFGAILVAIGSMLSSSSAFAASITWGYTYSVSAYADPFASPVGLIQQTAGSGTLSPNAGDSVHVEGSGRFGGSASASASVNGSNGLLGLSLAITGEGVPPFGGTRSGASATLTYTDTLTLTSSTLPDGTQVTLSGSLDLDFFASPACESGEFTIDRIRAAVNGAQGDWCSDLPFTINGTIGSPLSLSVTLSGELAMTPVATAYSGYLDASHTLRIILPYGADFSYQTESGNTFLGPTPTAVPEPASMLLLGAGLVGLAVRAKRSPQP